MLRGGREHWEQLSQLVLRGLAAILADPEALGCLDVRCSVAVELHERVSAGIGLRAETLVQPIG